MELVSNLSSKGVRLKAENGALIVDAPEGVLDETMWQTLAEKKPDLLPFFTHGWEVGWRTAAMMPQIPESGSIPFLVARKSENRGFQDCLSCGEPIDKSDGYICGYCSRAKNLALDLAMTFNQAGKNKIT